MIARLFRLWWRLMQRGGRLPVVGMNRQMRRQVRRWR